MPQATRLVVMAVFSLGLGIANGESDGGVAAGGRGMRGRDVAVSVLGGGKKVTALSASAEAGDRFSFEFSVAGFPNLKLKHFNRSADTVARTNFRVGLLRIAEVGDGHTAYTTPSFVRTTGKSDQWSNITVAQTGTVYNCSTTRIFDSGLLLRWEFYVTADAGLFGGVDLDPEAVKFSLYVENYPYTMQNSSLAFVAKVLSPNISGASDEWDAAGDGGDQVAIGSGVLAWETAAVADEVKVPLAAGSFKKRSLDEAGAESDDSGEPGEEAKFIAFTVDAEQPQTVFWDPTLAANGGDEFEDTDAPEPPTDSKAPGVASTLAPPTLVPVIPPRFDGASVAAPSALLLLASSILAAFC